MSMTRKDFVAIAEKMKRARNVMLDEQFAHAVAFQMVAFAEINSNFKPDVFMKACGMERDTDAFNKALAMFRLMN